MYLTDKQSTRVFKAFCDENRLHILSLLRGGEKCACKLLDELHIGQSTLSHHMKLLWEGGLVPRRRMGQHTLYRLDQSALERLLAVPLGREEPPLPTHPAPPPVIIRTGHKW